MLIIINGAFVYSDGPSAEGEPAVGGLLDYLIPPSDKAQEAFAGLESGWRKLEEWGFATKAGVEADGTPIKMATPSIMETYGEWLSFRDKWRSGEHLTDDLNKHVMLHTGVKRNAAEWESRHDKTSILGADGVNEVRNVEDVHLVRTIARTADEGVKQVEGAAKNVIDMGIKSADDAARYAVGGVIVGLVVVGIGIAIAAKR